MSLKRASAPHSDQATQSKWPTTIPNNEAPVYICDAQTGNLEGFMLERVQELPKQDWPQRI